MSTLTVKKATSLALSILQSKKFFYAVVILLVLQAAWMALTARYPMAFDENFHFGIIQIFSHQWSPFFSTAPPDSAAYGDLVRSSSYLYHYLMSFPYRLITLFTNQQMVQIIILRFINIALFAGGLFVFRTLLLRLKFSPGIVHFSLLMLVLIPVVPFLAGQINYDNLMFLLVPFVTLVTFTCAQKLKATGTIPAANLVLLLSLCMLTSLVKYAFLPIFAFVVFYLVFLLVRYKKPVATLGRTWKSFVAASLPLKLFLIISLVIAGGLFIERYGINIVEYHTFQPDCDKIETVEQCSQYGPYARNLSIAATNEKAGDVSYDPSLPLFLPAWIWGMMHRLYFAINYNYVNYYELPLPVATAYLVGLIGVVLCGVYYRKLLQNRQLILIIGVTLAYVAALMYVNLSDYLHYKTMLAINGRYLILILPFAFALIATGYSILLNKKLALSKRKPFKAGLVVVVLLLTLQGGGILTFAVRSDPDWYWQTPFAQNLGNGLKDAAMPFIIGSNYKVRG